MQSVERIDARKFESSFFFLTSTWIIFVITLSTIFREDALLGRWLPYVGLLLAALLNLNQASLYYSKLSYATSNITLTALALWQLQHQVELVQFPYNISETKFGFFVFGGGIIIVSLGFFVSRMEFFPILLVAMLLLSTLSSTRNIWKLLDADLSASVNRIIIGLAVYLATLRSIQNINWSTKAFKKLNGCKNTFIAIIPISLNLWLAFRVDLMSSVASSYFHVSYYSDVIRSLRSGGTLLWDSPSQYGFLNVLMPSLLPFDSARQSLYVFQGTLMFLTNTFVVVAFYSRMRNKFSFLILSTSYVLVFYFADPGLIGPQLYPSSSAMRFAPSLLLVGAICWILTCKSIKTGWLYFAIFIGAFLNSLWSAESTFYCALALGFLFIGSLRIRLTNNDGVKPLSSSRILISGILGFSGAWLVITTYVFSRVQHLPDFRMFTMYAGGYAKGFGSMAFNISNPAWIFVVLIALAVSLFRHSEWHLALAASMVAGVLLAWLSYYIGRAVPDNVIAMFPLLIFTGIYVVILVSKDKVLSVNLSKVPTVVVSVTLVIAAVVSSIVTQNKFMEVVRTIRSINEPETKPAVTADNELVDLIKSQNFNEDTEFVYEGYLGTMPDLPVEKLGQSYNLESTWLPIPLGLLEEPISPQIQDRVTARFINQRRASGVLIFDLVERYPDRQELLLGLLEKTHNCNEVAASVNYRLVACNFRST